MTAPILIAIDLAAMAALVFGLYFPRHRRADLVAAFLGVNVGVLAVTLILASSLRRRSPTTSRPWPWACSPACPPRSLRCWAGSSR